MKVITAPNDIEITCNNKSVFLAGGIQNCSDWQSAVIDWLEKFDARRAYDLRDLVIFNPRQKDFKCSAEEQIRWEHNRLKECDIFSVFFVGSDSLQPISMYELGKWGNAKKHSIVTIQESYERRFDIECQRALDGKMWYIVPDDINEAARRHATYIAAAYVNLTSNQSTTSSIAITPPGHYITTATAGPSSQCNSSGVY